MIKEKNNITQALQVCWSLHDDQTKQRELHGLLDAMNAYQLHEGLILTESESDCITIEDKVITVMPVWLWLLRGFNKLSIRQKFTVKEYLAVAVELLTKDKQVDARL